MSRANYNMQQESIQHDDRPRACADDVISHG